MLAFEQEYPEALTGITDHFLVFAVRFTISLQEYFCFHFVSQQISKDAAEISNSPALMHAFPNINIPLFFCEKIKPSCTNLVHPLGVEKSGLINFIPLEYLAINN